MEPVCTIGIVNGGGNAPGLSAVICAAVRMTISVRGMRVIGIRNGFDGLIWPEGAKEMTEETVNGTAPRGGTILGTTNRGNPFTYKTTENGKPPENNPNGKPIPPAGPGNVANTTAFTLCEMLPKKIRVTVLGHVQRGGSPTPFDRVVATRMGVHAVDLVARGEFNRMVCLRGTQIESVPLEKALEVMKFVDPNSEIVHAARAVGTTFGDSAGSENCSSLSRCSAWSRLPR